MTIGLIGYGRFGRLAASILASKTKVLVYDPSRSPSRRIDKRIGRGSLQEVACQRIVVLAVPVSVLREVLHRICPLVLPGSIVIDVCAVKSKPVQWMSSILPPEVHVLGSHPLFGPDSFDRTLKGHRIVLCPVRGPKRIVQDAKRLLRRAGLTVHIMTPDAHDRMMAETVFLTQFVGRVLGAASLGTAKEGTLHYRHLRSIVNVARNDSEELFLDMWRYNHHARTVARKFNTGWSHLHRLLATVSS